jgi:phosphate transport system permease protein
VLLRRRLVERVAVALCAAALLLALLPLLHVVYTALSIGGSKLSWSFISEPASGLPYIGSEGGILNALVGTIILLFLGSLLAVPLGVISGVYLMDFGGGSVGGLVRTVADTLLSVPSLIWGLFGFLFLSSTVTSFGLHWNFSVLAGGVILGLIMLPIIARVTELSLADVPNAYREASLALGATRWYTMRRISLRVAQPGIVSGVLLALTNALGQTVALLLVNGYSLTMPRWPPQLTGQGASVGDMASLIYVYLEQPAPVLQAPAEAAAVILLLLVLAVSLISRGVIALGRKSYVR